MNTEKGITSPAEPELACAPSEQHVVKIFLVSYMPRALDNESVRIAVVMVGHSFVDARFARGWERVLALDPKADTELLTALMCEIRDKLRAPGQLEEMLLRMEDSWSNTIQISGGKGCLMENPSTEIEVLASQFLFVPK